MGEVFKLNHCYNVDCVPAMELFPDNYFDLAVVDPPYFSGPERRGFYGVQFHPEFKSRPNKPHPLFRRFIAAASNYDAQSREKTAQN